MWFKETIECSGEHDICSTMDSEVIFKDRWCLKPDFLTKIGNCRYLKNCALSVNVMHQIKDLQCRQK